MITPKQYGSHLTYATCQSFLSQGISIKSSGTTGPQKTVFRSPENLKLCNEVAVHSQNLTSKSRVYTICKLDHAGGMLAQTLPAHSVGADITVEDFNAYAFVKNIEQYTHTHITPNHAKAILSVKNFKQLDLSKLWVTCGSECVEWDHIEAFVKQGATFMANWGMSEIGPITINAVFNNIDYVNELRASSLNYSILGNIYYCDHKVEDGALYVRGDLCVYDDWFNTQDLVQDVNSTLYYVGRT